MRKCTYHKTYKWSDTKKLLDFGDYNYEYETYWKEPQTGKILVTDGVEDGQDIGTKIYLRGSQQRDFAVEADEFLDDQLADIAARPFAAVVPGSLQFAGIPDERLPLARGGAQ